jgi:hypothetical protein
MVIVIEKTPNLTKGIISSTVDRIFGVLFPVMMISTKN